MKNSVVCCLFPLGTLKRCDGAPSYPTEKMQHFLETLASLMISLWKWIQRTFGTMYVARMIPGPRALPVFGNVLEIVPANSEAFMKYLEETRHKFGELHRIYLGPLLVVISGKREDHEMIFSGNEYPEKGFMYTFLKPWLGKGLLLSSGEKWRSRRKILTPAFHFKILDQFIPVFNSCGDEFVRQLQKRADGSAFDVWPLVKLLTLDVICETTMGVKMNAQTNSTSAYVTSVNDMSGIIYEKSLKPWTWIPYVFPLTDLGKRHKKCLDILHGTTDRVIRERKEELQKMNEGDKVLDVDELGRRRRVAFLDLLLLTARDGSLSDADIREEVDTFMFEGHDTTAAAISFTLFFLSRHQDVQDKVLQELESVFHTNEPLQLSMQQLSDLKYLEMVVKEAMRIYPPVAAVARAVTSDLQLKSRNFTLPIGTTLFLSFWILHRNQKVFPDPESFDPERFSPEASASRHPFAYLPFSAGSRNCIGQRFAMLEMKSLLAKTIWNFRILPVEDFEPIVVWELISKSMNGISVRMEKRHRKAQ